VTIQSTKAPTQGASPAPPDQHEYGLAIFVIASATLMVTLDATIVNVAIPSIKLALHFSSAGVEWVVAAYSLAFGGLLLPGGRTGDLFGRRRMFVVGIGLFTVASLVGGLAVAAPMLLAARTVQGVGAAIAMPTALSLIATTFPEGSVRGRAMAIYAAMSSVGGALGMILGGVLTDALSWRWVLLVNVPIGVVIVLLAPKVLPAGSGNRRGGIDVLGAILATAGMTLLVYSLVQASEHSWGESGTLVPLIASAVGLALFVAVEDRVERPILPLHILANRNRSGAYLITLAVGIGLYGVAFFLMLFMQDVLGYQPLRAGLSFLPFVVGIGIAAFGMGRLVGKIGYRPGVTFGPLIAAGGVLWLAAVTSQSTGFGALFTPMLILGLGLGLAVVPLTLTAISGVQPMEAGIASALVSVGQQVGSSVGLAVLGAVASAVTTSRVHDLGQGAVAAATADGYQRSFLVAGGVLIVASLLAVGVIRGNRPQMAPPPKPAPVPEV
jgi:EmrB/QacA subfamily drug resistance transporter